MFLVKENPDTSALFPWCHQCRLWQLFWLVIKGFMTRLAGHTCPISVIIRSLVTGVRVFLGVHTWELLSETELVSVLSECLLMFVRTHLYWGLVWFSSSHPVLVCAPLRWPACSPGTFCITDVPEGEHLSYIPIWAWFRCFCILPQLFCMLIWVTVVDVKYSICKQGFYF